MSNLTTLIEEVGALTQIMWQRGWDEKNGGNISCLVPFDTIGDVVLETKASKQLENIPKNLWGKHVLVTASGSYFKNINAHLDKELGLIKLAENGSGYSVVWGFTTGKEPTSELYTHLLSHSQRLSVDPNHRVIVHNHATNTSAMTFTHELDEAKFTRTLWGLITECLIVFPDGVSVLPWMICGNEAIGQATAQKMAHSRIVIWAYHGILAAGSDLDDAFGLIETVEKAAEIYIKTLGYRQGQIADQELRDLARAFNVTPRAGILQ